MTMIRVLTSGNGSFYVWSQSDLVIRLSEVYFPGINLCEWVMIK